MHELGEFELIARYFERAVKRAALGIGDDCALLTVAPGQQLAVSSDMLVEGRHFVSTVDPERLGITGASAGGHLSLMAAGTADEGDATSKDPVEKQPSRVAAVVSTQAKQWYESDTQIWVDVTAPDHVLVSGRLAKGAVASVHVAAVPWAASGFRMEVYGRDGTLVATSADSPQLGETIKLHGARGSNTLAPLEIPASFAHAPPATPQGDPYNVGEMYCAFARAIRTGKGTQPTFDDALRLHRFVDAIQRSSDTGTEVSIG